MSLRVRLALAFALLAALVAASVGVVVYELSAQDLLDRARARAVANVRSAARLYPLTKPLPPYPALRTGDSSVPKPLRAAVARGLVATYHGSWRGEPAIWAGRPAADGTPLFVRSSYLAEQRSLDDLRTKLIEAAIAAAVGGALLGAVLATSLSLRLRRAAAAAEQVAGGDLDARIDAHGHDEVAALGQAVDRMADALKLRIEREERFVADVAHDLRTPVTGLVTAASLLESDQVGSAIKERVGHLSELVEDLLEIARLENGSATADLRWVDVAALSHSVAARHPGVEVHADAPCRALVDPRRLERVLENVIANAERHGAPPIVVEVSPGSVRIIDAGRGFPADMLERATERFASGDSARGDGVGLGLAIAAAQARVIGGVLRLANGPGGGAVVTVELPRVEQ
ncbi:MAG TPA: HAMP domain-containing sensor histidine kinase [Gaiellales bacterium]|nr:HAMP domain-containing sensor histidine kinase [Gaiellales bacterium]